MSGQRVARQDVADALLYAWNHCDDERGEEVLLWVAEKIAERVGGTFEFPDARIGRILIADGVRGQMSRPLAAA